MDKALPPFLRRLSEELGYQVSRTKAALGYELFAIDLSAWKLRLSSRTPVIWAQKADLEASTPQHLAQSLLDVARERSLDRQITLVLVDGEGQPLRGYLSSPLHSFVVLGCSRTGTGAPVTAAQRRAAGPDLGPGADLQPGPVRDQGAGDRQPFLWPRVRGVAHHRQP